MDNIINRREIASGVYFSKITDSRYKFNYIAVNFFRKAEEAHSAEYALVANILPKSCAKYPTISSFQKYCSKLYRASIGATLSNMSDYQKYGMTAYYMDDRFALRNENLTALVTELLIDCIFNPALKDGVFPEETVEIEKGMLTDRIKAAINEKRSYAADKLLENLCEGEPASVKLLGTEEAVKKITPKSAYDAYLNMLNTMHCEIICVGRSNFEDAEKLLKEAFSKLSRNVGFSFVHSYSPFKNEVKEVTERMNVNQSKMAIGFKSHCDDKGAMVLLQKVYGGTTTSKLFTNVREKMSLCYYCSAGYNSTKGLLTVNCGVEKENIEKAKDEIIRQLELIKQGDFTDEEISASELATKNGFNSISDSASGLADFYINRIVLNDIKTPAEVLQTYLGVSRDRIINAAKSVQLDTVYVLTSNEE